jgi:hypothetical protein
MQDWYPRSWFIRVFGAAVSIGIIVVIVFLAYITRDSQNEINKSIGDNNAASHQFLIVPGFTCTDDDLEKLANQIFAVDSIPKVEISVAGEFNKLSGIWNEGLSFSMQDETFTANNHSNLTGIIKTRGYTSYLAGEFFDDTFPYKIKLDEAVDFFGFGEHREWIFLPNILDRSAIRQFYFPNIGQLMMCHEGHFSPETKYVELYFGGEYKGLYIMIESIEANKNRLEIRDGYNPRTPETPFVVQMENGRMPRLWHPHHTDNDFFMIDDPAMPCWNYAELGGATITDTMITLQHPRFFNDITGHQGEYIRHTVSDLYRHARERRPYEELGINTASFVNWYLHGELFQNSGWGSSSVFMYKPIGQDIVMGPLWDFDFLVMEDTGVGFTRSEACDNNLYRYLLKYDEFRSAMKERLLWFQQKIVPIASAKLDYLQNNELLRNAVMRNQERHPTWGDPFTLFTGKYYPPAVIAATTWDEHIEHIRGVLFDGMVIEGREYSNRVQWIIDNFDELK